MARLSDETCGHTARSPEMMHVKWPSCASEPILAGPARARPGRHGEGARRSRTVGLGRWGPIGPGREPRDESLSGL